MLLSCTDTPYSSNVMPAIDPLDIMINSAPVGRCEATTASAGATPGAVMERIG
jgi:hypothetical protein